MSDMQARYGKQGLTVVAVNLDQDQTLADRFLAAYKPGFTVAYDAKGVSAEKYEVKGMPSSYLIDRAGRIHARHIGFREQDKVQLEDEIRLLVQAGTEVKNP
jgi:peroxiredoxin